ncbi:hypothetical protein DPMN_138591 [Dreissena polymorpha]|uniref:Uncharacterized protein n=1 Tax=Dreissena polymorpha TaxID=45954 RepID=A0A9D4JJZ5_DREPO|nr:hypothetical protein DPMN_138591 [Dreissena polymorpha]
MTRVPVQTRTKRLNPKLVGGNPTSVIGSRARMEPYARIYLEHSSVYVLRVGREPTVKLTSTNADCSPLASIMASATMEQAHTPASVLEAGLERTVKST